jgi:DNA-binding transcriptional regulator YbjK
MMSAHLTQTSQTSRASAVLVSRKGAERKNKILEAALKIIGREGMASLSMRALAAAAQTPLGALGYYFENKQQLISEVFALHTQRELRRVLRSVASIGEADSARNLAKALADFIIEGLESPGHAVVAEYEFIIEASRRPELARASSAWQHSLHAQLMNVLEACGSVSLDTDARLVMAVMAGLEVDNLTRGNLSPSQILDIRNSMDHLLSVVSENWRSISSSEIDSNESRPSVHVPSSSEAAS